MSGRKKIRQINFVTFFDVRSSPEQAAGRIVLITALCCTTVVSPVALLIFISWPEEFSKQKFSNGSAEIFSGDF